MLLSILIGLVIIVAVILIVASTKPNSVHYERSIAINATPERILPHVHDFRKWAAWSPWDKMDPTMKREYSGAPHGVGARYGWNSKGQPGEGSMEILEASSNGVKVDLRFVRPFKNECLATFHFTPQGTTTAVRWAMDGPNLFMGKLFSVFMNMDKMIGKDFEAGLAALKAEAEK